MFIHIYNFLHKPLLFLMKSIRNFDLKIIDECNLPKSEPVIYVFNHTNSHDIPTASEIIQKHHFVLLGKQPLKLIDRIAFCLNGVIWVDRKDKCSKQNAKDKIIKCLNKGINILIFPEGTWNRSPNKIMLPLYWGVIDIARICNIPICPIILDYADNVCYAKIGKTITISKDADKGTAINYLRDTMATIRYELWEMQPILHRKSISTAYYNNKLKKEVNEYPKLNLEYEISVERKEYEDCNDVFEHLDHIKPNLKTAFLFNKRLR